MSDDDTKNKLDAFDLADKRLHDAEAALEECRALIAKFVAHVDQFRWRNIRFTNHVAPAPVNVAMPDADETFSVERWPNREQIRRLLETRQQACAVRQAALLALPESLRATRSGCSAGVHVTQCGSPHKETTAPFWSVMLIVSFSPVSFSASAAMARNTLARHSFSVI
jgi:hypothetical protein